MAGTSKTGFETRQYVTAWCLQFSPANCPTLCRGLEQGQMSIPKLHLLKRTLHAETSEQPPVDGRPVLAAGLRQVALAASLAALAPGPLLDELADELGMLWPTRIQPALLRAQHYLRLWTDRCDTACMSHSKCMASTLVLISQMFGKFEFGLLASSLPFPQSRSACFSGQVANSSHKQQ